jgi:23S rRNA (cytidine1920-2'-O)/16S rRNA (cytidine1409-2'-O)-methyltransferase
VKIRLDELLVKNGLFGSRTKAQASIIAGLILADEQKIEKPGIKVEETAVIRVLGNACPYVSRGGLKLERALDDFKVDVNGLIAADIGAGTGGFTDCLLQRGAKKVYAIDVGYGQIDWKLRKDKRVVVIERKNARNLAQKDIGEKVDLVVMDVSFISILKILPAVTDILKENGIVVTLVKPQFEAGKEDVPRGGVVRNASVHKKVIDNVRTGVEALGYEYLGDTRSPITGKDGNVEFFMHLRRKL